MIGSEISTKALSQLVPRFGFMVIGGEWFVMWQSTTWNGQEAAFRFYVTALAALIFVNQPDGDLSALAKSTPASKRAPMKKRAPAKKKATARRRTATPEDS